MKKIQFNIKYKEEIETKKIQVITREGKPVDVIKWDLSGDRPILAVIKDSEDYEYPLAYRENGSLGDPGEGIDKLDLFMIIDEPSEELNEFEKAVGEWIYGGVDEELNVESVIKTAARELLTLARKVLADEYDGKAMLYVGNRSFELGKKEAKYELRKSLPTWNRCPEATGHMPEVSGIMTDWIIKYNGYSISMNELVEKLPKDDD